MLPRRKLKLAALSTVTTVLAACGGGDDDTPPAPAPAPTVACAWDTTVALAYEEQRLTTPMPTGVATAPGTNTTPVAERLVVGAGFESFNPISRAPCPRPVA